MKVFWSWQSDLPASVGKHFVKGALSDAVEQIAEDLLLTDADRPDVDHDTKGEPGMVDITATILRKIEESAAFVADVTPVGKTVAGKALPNPNVMIELGYAVKARGTERVVLVGNAAYGASVEALPFDLRHRRGPILYNLPEGATPALIASERKKLAKELAEALQLNLQDALKRRDAAITFPLHPASEHDPAMWREAVPGIEHNDFFADGGAPSSWQVSQGAKSFLRICPMGWSKSRPTRRQLEALRDDLCLRAFGRSTNGDGGANTLGVVEVGLDMRAQCSGRVHAVSQWFDKTGEIWGFNARVTGNQGGRLQFSHLAVLQDWAEFLALTLKILKYFKADLPYRVEAGATGLDGTYWSGGGLTRALEHVAIHHHQDRDWGSSAQRAFIVSAYEKLCDAFNQPRWTEDQVVAYLGPQMFESGD